MYQILQWHPISVAAFLVACLSTVMFLSVVFYFMVIERTINELIKLEKAKRISGFPFPLNSIDLTGLTCKGNCDSCQNKA